MKCKYCLLLPHLPIYCIRVFVQAIDPSLKGLAAQSKAEAIGWNKISSANQRPGFQMIFYTCQSARHMIMQLWFAV